MLATHLKLIYDMHMQVNSKLDNAHKVNKYTNFTILYIGFSNSIEKVQYIFHPE